MKILVLGASGKVGQKVVPLLLSEGHKVRAFVHNHNPFESAPNLEVIRGDVHKPDDMAKAIKGMDAVIGTLGSWGTATKDIQVSAMQNLIPAMRAAGIKRIVSLTGSGAYDPADKLTISKFIGRLVPLKVFKDGSRHISLLSESDLDWTVLRSPVMKESGDLKGYKIGEKWPGAFSTINRNSVARALVELVGSRNWVKKSPYIKKA